MDVLDQIDHIIDILVNSKNRCVVKIVIFFLLYSFLKIITCPPPPIKSLEPL